MPKNAEVLQFPVLKLRPHLRRAYYWKLVRLRNELLERLSEYRDAANRFEEARRLVPGFDPGFRAFDLIILIERLEDAIDELTTYLR